MMMMMMMNTQWWASRAQLRATLSTVIISSFLFSLAEVALSVVPEPSDCEPRHCGKGPNISYPFRIDDGEQPDYCGYPGFQVSCQDDEPVIKASSESVVVQEIFYENMSLIVSDVEFRNTSCPYPRYNHDLAITAINFSPINRELFFYLNCTERIPELLMLECAENSKDKFSFVTDRPVPSNGSCESVFVTRVLADGAIDGRSYASALSKGFLLEWKAPNCNGCQTSGGRCGFNHTSNQFMCICGDGVHLVDCVRLPDNSQKRRIKIILGITTGGSGLLLACIILCCLRYKKNSNPCPLWAMKSRDSHNIVAFLEQYGSTVPKRYRYSEVKKMTKSFSDKLGQGGFGAVFKGKLQDGRLVAVKVLNKSNENGEDFINEVASIGRTQHVNIVRLLGFVYERSKRALLYEFMPNGSLEKFIFSTKQSDTTLLGWEKLLEISIGIARGLEYLHRGCNTRIVHFDIKPHNILLDDDFCPKISDFGLAKTCHPKQSILSRVDTRGTIGYIAPEVFSRKFGVISSKSDVYSYGMMVLEMVGGRKNADTGMDNTSEIYFPHWIYEHFNEDDGLKFRGITSETEEVARKMVLVGLWCIQTSPSGRPSMTKVVEMLEGKNEDLSMPPKPYLCSP